MTVIIGTGARDGKIMIWDIRCNRRNGHYKPVNVIHNAHMVQRNGTPQQIRKRSRRRSSVAQINSVSQIIPLKDSASFHTCIY